MWAEHARSSHANHHKSFLLLWEEMRWGADKAQECTSRNPVLDISGQKNGVHHYPRQFSSSQSLWLIWAQLFNLWPFTIVAFLREDNMKTLPKIEAFSHMYEFTSLRAKHFFIFFSNHYWMVYHLSWKTKTWLVSLHQLNWLFA